MQSMVHPSRTACRAAAVALIAASAPARATVVVPYDLDQLTDHADRVVLARVESSQAHWTSDHSAIVTDVVLRVEVPLKGGLRAGDQVTVRREGGEVDGLGMRVAGAARFAVGEEVVAFLERRGAYTWTVGMAQGKLHVAELDGRRVVVRDTAGLAFARRVERPEPRVRPLEELMAQVADRARAQGAR
jgi:hypothetical protein